MFRCSAPFLAGGATTDATFLTFTEKNAPTNLWWWLFDIYDDWQASQ
jgi:hypothetical protein